MTREALRELRDKHHLTQRELGLMLGYSENYIMRLERGHEKITPRFERLVSSMFSYGKTRKYSTTT